MRILIVIFTLIFLSTSNVNSTDNSYRGELENCKDYKISPNAIICGVKKAGGNFKRNITTKKDGSLNFLGKWFGSKSLKDFNNK